MEGAGNPVKHRRDWPPGLGFTPTPRWETAPSYRRLPLFAASAWGERDPLRRV